MTKYECNIARINTLFADANHMKTTCVEEEHRNWWDGRANAFQEVIQIIQAEPDKFPSLVRAFKKQICKVMGETSSSLFARQTLPIAWNVAVSLGYDPVKFCREVGFSPMLLAEMDYVPSEDVDWSSDEQSFNTRV